MPHPGATAVAASQYHKGLSVALTEPPALLSLSRTKQYSMALLHHAIILHHRACAAALTPALLTDLVWYSTPAHGG